MRDEKIAEASKLLENGKISVQDFLNRMLWNDEELIKFFGDFEAVDPCGEDDVSAYESEDETMEDSDSQSSESNILDPTMCTHCRLRKICVVTSCGHFACDQCWSEWIEKENKLLDESNKPAYAIKFEKKFPRCLQCLNKVQHTTKIQFPS